MADKELTARLRLPWPKDGSGDEVTLPLWVLILTAEAADRIEALSEQLEAAHADAKEAEAYAEELARDLVKADNDINDRDAKLAAAVDWFETIRDRAKGDYMAHTYYLDALAALATIKRREP